MDKNKKIIYDEKFLIDFRNAYIKNNFSIKKTCDILNVGYQSIKKKRKKDENFRKYLDSIKNEFYNNLILKNNNKEFEKKEIKNNTYVHVPDKFFYEYFDDINTREEIKKHILSSCKKSPNFLLSILRYVYGAGGNTTQFINNNYNIENNNNKEGVVIILDPEENN